MGREAISKLANQAVRVWERVRGDTAAKIALRIMGAGIVLLSGGSLVSALSVSISPEDGNDYSIGLDFGGIGVAVAIFGGLLVVLGVALAVMRFRVHIKRENGHQAALIFFHGFPRMNNEVPLSALPRSERGTATEVTPHRLDSYDANALIAEYPLTAHVVQGRVYHGAVSRAYIAGLGSVPYLYLMGTIVRDGHLPIRILDHDRTTNQWHLLDDLGTPRVLQFRFSGCTDRRGILNALQEAGSDAIGLAISFTEVICSSDLPESLRDRTVAINLGGEPTYDALRCEPVQEEVAEKVAHFINAVAKTTSEVHLFICAQASFVLRLGSLYQDGMTGPVAIHNYDASSKSYAWSVRFDGRAPSRLPQNSAGP